jgi:plastocyanin
MAEANSSLARSLVGKILFVVGVLILLAFLAWAVLKVVPKIVSSIAGVGGSVSGIFSSDEVTASVSPQTVESGDDATLTWGYDGSAAGSFSLSYDCAEGLNVKMQRGGSTKTLTCETEYSLGTKNGEAVLTPSLSEDERLVDMDLRVVFENTQGDVLGEDRTLLTVTAGDEEDDLDEADEGDEAATEGTVEYEAPVSTGGTHYTAPSGPADLAVLNYAVDSGNRLQFTVLNQGARSTGQWYFTYTTPTDPEDTFLSPAMANLNPGDTLRVTVRFGEVDSGSHTVDVWVDPYGYITETNESNNRFSVSVRGSGSSNGGGNDDANLEIDELESGRLDGRSFREDDEIDEGDEAAVRFVVENTGDEDTGSWRYEVQLPGDDYRSGRQDSLEPGESQEIIVGFDELDSGTYTIRVEVDSDDDVDEEEEGDNDDSVRLRVDD